MQSQYCALHYSASRGKMTENYDIKLEDIKDLRNVESRNMMENKTNLVAVFIVLLFFQLLAHLATSK